MRIALTILVALLDNDTPTPIPCFADQQMSNNSPPHSVSDEAPTIGQPVSRAAAMHGFAPPPPGWYAQQQQQRPQIEADEIGPNGSDKARKALVLEIKSASKKGQRSNQYEGAMVLALAQEIMHVYGAPEMLPLSLFTCQYVQKKNGFVVAMPPSVAEAVLYIGGLKVVGEDDNVLEVSAAVFDDDITKARTNNDVLFAFVYPKAGATDTDPEVEELVRIGLRSVGLELSDFERAKTREGTLRNCMNIRFKSIGGPNIDADVIHKLRTVPLTAPSGAPVNVALAGEFCTHIGICKSCYRKGTCWCNAQNGQTRPRLPKNTESIQRRLIDKQRKR